MRSELAIIPFLLVLACSRTNEAQVAGRSSAPEGSVASGSKADANPAATPVVPPAGPLDSLDFVVLGIDGRMDTATTRIRMGQPDSITRHANPVERSIDLFTWYYQDLILDVRYGVVGGITLHTPTIATARGLRVGDSATRAQLLYGEPTGASKDGWYYEDPKDDSGLHVITFAIVNGVVRAIFLGYVLD